jgi:diguanylate cyclase (GGDEF)-like protein
VPVTDIDPHSHESSAAALARLVSLVDAQARIVRDHEASARSRDIFERASAAGRLGVWECDLSTETLSWSCGTYDIFGIPRLLPLVRKQALVCYPAQSLKTLEAARAPAIERRQGFSLDAEIVTPQGKRRWIRISAAVECAGDRAIRLFGVKQDVTEERAQSERLHYLAAIDALTDLANESQFQTRLAAACEADVIRPGFLLLVDLDDFGQVNDAHGHVAGDLCLKNAAERLAEACGGTSFVARLGRDEFAVLLYPEGSVTRVNMMAARIVRSMGQPFDCDGHSFKIGASIGIAAIDGRSAYEVSQRAEAALRAAKTAGRNTYRWFVADRT